MPIYEFRCAHCDHAFEAIVRVGASADCPECGASDPERLISTPAVQSTATRGSAMRAARQRDSRQASDRMHERLRAEESHDRHG